MEIASNQNQVLATFVGQVGRLTLNRPAALHALTLDMVTILTNALLAWRVDPSVSVVVIDHSGPRGFCAGGDIAMLAASGATDSIAARAFFHAEYRLNHLIFTYPKPIVAIMDGITMGGGVGISIHAPFRIGTQRTTFAMPETGIGLFPDVGGGWFLPRLDGQVGIWLALTGARLKAADGLQAGVVTHFVSTEALELLASKIAEAARQPDVHGALVVCLATIHSDAGVVRELTPEVLEKIKSCFAFDQVDDIFAALSRDGSPWALAQIEILKTKSPQTLKVALRQMRTGAKAISFVDNMAMEFRIGARVISLHDFQEGVRAVIIDKDNAPNWKPKTLVDVTDASLDAIFAPLPYDEEWTPLP